ncbi:MAG: hypothetical protein U0736_22480 [Gemmataceae bacterium]
MNRFDLHPTFFRDGRPEDYRSERKGPHRRPRPTGSRMGPQNMVCCGIALQLLAERPGLWERRYRKEFAKDLRVSAARSASEGFASEGMLRFRVHGNALEISGETEAASVTLTVYARPDGAGSFARLTIPARGPVQAVNDQGQTLVVEGLARDAGEGRGFAFTLRLPCTSHVAQKAAWANLVEHGRYSVRVGEKMRNLYVASSEEQVIAWLRRELGEGLRTWRTVFWQKGYIPTGMGVDEWERFSDSGGYAHLLAAGAQWLLVLDGKRDWDGLGVPDLSTGAK